jgi:TetR/AcrR family transcriptional regulator, cholesterol catabolism regulator
MPRAKPPGQRARQKEQKRRRLRDAAWALFRAQGYEATTTKQIAERAGVASGTLFLYARDKPDLLFLVLHERLSQAVDDGLESLPRAASLIDQLVHLFSGFFRVYEAAPEIGRRFIREMPGADGPNAQRVNALTLGLLGQIAGLVQLAQARGEVAPDADPLLFAQVAFSLYYTVLLGWLSGYSPLESSVPRLRAALELAFYGIARR